MTINTPKMKFRFISSYRGQHDFMVRFADGSESRLHVRVCPETYDKDCTMSPGDFQAWVNDRQGYLTGREELLTEELVVAFNRQCYEKWRSEVDQIIADPARYGEWDGRKYLVNVGARYCRETRKWLPLQTFESVRDLAGIPPESCADPLPAAMSHPARLDLCR